MTKGGLPTVPRALLLGTIVTFLGYAHPAFAGRDAARAHYERGRLAMSQGNHQLAATEFLAAWGEEPSPRTLLAIAMAYERAGDPQAASGYYWWYLNSGAATPAESEWLFPKIVALSTTQARPVEAPKPPPAPAPKSAPAPAPAPTPDPESAQVPGPGPEPGPDPEEVPSRRPEPRPPSDDTASPTTPRWYGLPMLLTEGVGFGVLVAGVENDSGETVALGVATVLLTSPIVHTYYGHGARGWGGFFLRLGGAALGGAAGDEEGAAVGYITAFLLDAFLNARDEVPAESSVAPLVQIRDGHATFGLAGSF